MKNIQSLKDDSRQTWSNINEMLNRKISHKVTKLTNESGGIITGQTMINHFNTYFTSIAPKLVEIIPFPTNFEYLREINIISNSCFLYPTDEVECYHVIKQMKNKGNSLCKNN